MPRPLQARSRTERGAAAVEFALVAPILILLLFGMVTTAMTYSDHVSATNAVREAARYGAAADATSSSWATSVRDRVKQVYFNAGASAPTNSQICVRLVKSDGSTYAQTLGTSCGTAPTVPTGMASGSCAVLVWMQRPEKIDLVLVPAMHLNIGAESVAYYGRQLTSTPSTPSPCTAA